MCSSVSSSLLARGRTRAEEGHLLEDTGGDTTSLTKKKESNGIPPGWTWKLPYRML